MHLVADDALLFARRQRRPSPAASDRPVAIGYILSRAASAAPQNQESEMPAAIDHRVTTLAELEALYDKPSGPSIVKEIDHVNGHYRALIAASPFVVTATSGPEGLDCSPKGDAPGFVRVADDR